MRGTSGPADLGIARTLAFLLIAPLIGTLFVSVPYFADAAASWGREGRWLWGLAQTYALALAGGFLMQVVCALVLLGLTRAAGLDRVTHWFLLGALFGVVLPWAFARLGYVVERMYFAPELQPLKSALMFPLVGAMMFERQPLPMLMTVGAATGGAFYVLSRALGRRRRV